MRLACHPHTEAHTRTVNIVEQWGTQPTYIHTPRDDGTEPSPLCYTASPFEDRSLNNSCTWMTSLHLSFSLMSSIPACATLIKELKFLAYNLLVALGVLCSKTKKPSLFLCVIGSFHPQHVREGLWCFSTLFLYFSKCYWSYSGSQ